MTITVTTDYGTNKGPLENIIDGKTNTYWGVSEGQAAGKSIVFTFSGPVTFHGITAISGSANGTQIISGTSLEISSDGVNWKKVGSFNGTKTSTISGLSEQRVTAVRIYWNSGNNKKLAFYEAQFSYTEETSYIRKDGAWHPVRKVYEKVNGRWTEKDDPSVLKDKNILRQGTE